MISGGLAQVFHAPIDLKSTIVKCRCQISISESPGQMLEMHILGSPPESSGLAPEVLTRPPSAFDKC